MPYSARWKDLEDLAEKTASSGPDGFSILEWSLLETELNQLEAAGDIEGILRLREMFKALVKGETSGGIALVQRLNDAGLHAAQQSRQYILQARYLFDRGENLHRQGYHLASIDSFTKASSIYSSEHEHELARQSYYFTALPLRALSRIDDARQVLGKVLQETDPSDPWRANPLQVLSWIERDAGRYARSESILREALQLYTKIGGRKSPHIVQTLADLGEITGLQGHTVEAFDFFTQSTDLANELGGQYSRQGARTRLKHAELLIRNNNDDLALRLLNEADDLIRGYGHYYDLLWRIELARMFVFENQRRWGDALRKLRSTISLRKEIGLNSADLIRQVRRRRRRGTGLPK